MPWCISAAWRPAAGTVEQDSLLFLNRTDLPARPFVLYGRHNPDLGTRSRFFAAGGFSDAACYVAFHGLPKRDAMQRVFNPDANCFSFPYVDTLTATPDSLSFARHDPGDAQPAAFYTFRNPEGYNDFVAGFAPEWTQVQAERVSPLPTAALRPDGLYLFQSDHLARRGALALGAEDSAFLAEATAGTAEPDSVFYNPRYKAADLDGPAELHAYTFLPGKNALVTNAYTEGAEARDNFDFNDLSILYRFRAMHDVAERVQRLRPVPGSVFQATCR